jgi:hypothetical protein
VGIVKRGLKTIATAIAYVVITLLMIGLAMLMAQPYP